MAGEADLPSFLFGLSDSAFESGSKRKGREKGHKLVPETSIGSPKQNQHVETTAAMSDFSSCLKTIPQTPSGNGLNFRMQRFLENYFGDGPWTPFNATIRSRTVTAPFFAYFPSSHLGSTLSGSLEAQSSSLHSEHQNSTAGSWSDDETSMISNPYETVAETGNWSGTQTHAGEGQTSTLSNSAVAATPTQLPQADNSPSGTANSVQQWHSRADIEKWVGKPSVAYEKQPGRASYPARHQNLEAVLQASCAASRYAIEEKVVDVAVQLRPEHRKGRGWFKLPCPPTPSPNNRLTPSLVAKVIQIELAINSYPQKRGSYTGSQHDGEMPTAKTSDRANVGLIMGRVRRPVIPSLTCIFGPGVVDRHSDRVTLLLGLIYTEAAVTLLPRTLTNPCLQLPLVSNITPLELTQEAAAFLAAITVVRTEYSSGQEAPPSPIYHGKSSQQLERFLVPHSSVSSVLSLEYLGQYLRRGHGTRNRAIAPLQRSPAALSNRFLHSLRGLSPRIWSVVQHEGEASASPSQAQNSGKKSKTRGRPSISAGNGNRVNKGKGGSKPPGPIISDQQVLLNLLQQDISFRCPIYAADEEGVLDKCSGYCTKTVQSLKDYHLRTHHGFATALMRYDSKRGDTEEAKWYKLFERLTTRSSGPSDQATWKQRHPGKDLPSPYHYKDEQERRIVTTALQRLARSQLLPVARPDVESPPFSVHDTQSESTPQHQNSIDDTRTSQSSNPDLAVPVPGPQRAQTVPGTHPVIFTSTQGRVVNPEASSSQQDVVNSTTSRSVSAQLQEGTSTLPTTISPFQGPRIILRVDICTCQFPDYTGRCVGSSVNEVCVNEVCIHCTGHNLYSGLMQSLLNFVGQHTSTQGSWFLYFILCPCTNRTFADFCNICRGYPNCNLLMQSLLRLHKAKICNHPEDVHQLADGHPRSISSNESGRG